MDLDTVIYKARKLAPQDSNEQKQTFISELEKFEEFMEDDGFDLDDLKDDPGQIRDGYLSSANRRNAKQAIKVFNTITSIINPSSISVRNVHYGHHGLIIRKKCNRFDHFTNLIDFKKSYSAFVTRDESYITVDKHVPDKYRFLKPLEKISVKNRIPLGEYLITGYHNSGLEINEYIAENELFNQLKEKYNLSPNNRHYSIAHETMSNYLIEYEKHVCKPLSLIPKNDSKYISKYDDDITIIINYIIEINNGINKILSAKTSYPVQLDVFFVAPNMYDELNLHSLKGLKDEIKSDQNSRKNGAVDAICDIYNLLRRAANNINKCNGQRFIMLIVRNKLKDTSLDTVYIYKSVKDYNTIAPEFISDNVELTYLLNSKLCPIIGDLNSTDNGILGLTHHLHSTDCNKVYLSYNNFKSRVFKNNFLSNLSLIFNSTNDDNRHILCNRQIDFFNSYKEFTDFGYNQIGEYWFNNSKSYECFEPYWNPQNCRAMGNVFIPKSSPSCTVELMKYIDEYFESPAKLYYKMDYTIGMQIVDKQTVYIKLKNNKNICLINTELHHNGQILYAIIVENTFKSSKQKWKIIHYKHISEAFMTPQQLIDKFGIFICDLPVGSKTKHNNFAEYKEKIQVTKQLIRNTNWNCVRIVQSRQNLNRLDKRNGGAIEISERRFKQLAFKSLEENENDLTPIAHFKFRKNKYHLEKLLPVYIPEHDKYVAISFCYNQIRDFYKTQVSGVCLDLVDMKNKAGLIQEIPNNSWLNVINNNMTINNLIIGQFDTPPTKNIKNVKNTKKIKNTKKYKKHTKNKTPKTPKTPSTPKKPPQRPYICTNNINVLNNGQHSTNASIPALPSIPIGNIESTIQPIQQIQPTMQSMPMQSMPMQSMPMQSMPMQSMPMQSMPMQSMPMQSMPQLQPVQSIPCYQNVQNAIPCSVPNMQQFQLNAQYFQQFLPPNSNMNTTGVHYVYNTANTAVNYNMPFNQNQYY